MIYAPRSTTLVVTMAENTRPPALEVRQVRLPKDVLDRVTARCKELRMPVARYIALAVTRSLGPAEGVDELFGDLKQLRDIEERLR